MTPFRLATFSHRGYDRVGIELNGYMLDFALAYEELKRASGRRDFFKARHGLTMLEVLEEWDLYLAAFEHIADHYASALPGKAEKQPFVYRKDEIRFRPPVMYPNKVLNAGSNYFASGLAPTSTSLGDRAHPSDPRLIRFARNMLADMVRR